VIVRAGNCDYADLAQQPAIKANVDSGRARPGIKARSQDVDNDADLESLSEGFDDDADEMDDGIIPAEDRIPRPNELLLNDDEDETRNKRKRKRKDGDDLEGKYLDKIVQEEARDLERLAAARASKRPRQQDSKNGPQLQENETDVNDSVEEQGEDSLEEEPAGTDGDESDSGDDQDGAVVEPLPKHETEVKADEDLAKANRTVFLGNVSTTAITSKAHRKALMTHLGSFFTDLPDSKTGTTKPKVESLRFRSTPYASAIPRKAAYAKQEVMDATTKSTNAYAVYSAPHLAREAAKRLNGTTVLDRHLRVDEVAHPAKVDNRRCVFVGNLGFVDDETNIQDANEEEGREKRKRGKEPADVEEGLWRTFAKCGNVESVRVIRDSTTRVGKGIAYVQFEDENAVEAALLFNEKKFPPMLPRKLRVTRAKAQKRNVKPGSDRPTSRPKTNGYQRKVTSEEASKLGRAGKLLGRAAASRIRKPEKTGSNAIALPSRAAPSQAPLGEGIRRPESFVFEGHRASSKQGKSGLKLGGKTSSKKVKVTKRSAAFKAKKRSA
jgi:nucleolar protein 12